MKTLKIGDKEYVLEFNFEAARHKQPFWFNRGRR